MFVYDSAVDLSLLTQSEARVARLVMEGLSNVEIARARGVATRTIVNQLSTIYPKLGLRSRRELKALSLAPASRPTPSGSTS